MPFESIWKRGIEIGTYCDERLSGAGFARRQGLRERHQSRHRLASLGDDDFLAELDPLEKLGQAGLRFVDVYGTCHLQNNRPSLELSPLRADSAAAINT